MDNLILYKRFPQHISKIKTIHHNGTIYYELIIDRNYKKKDTIIFETDPCNCVICSTRFDKYNKMLRWCKIELLKYINHNICDKIIEDITDKWVNTVRVETDTIGNETLWFIHLCYRCNKRFDKKNLKNRK